MVAWFHAPVRFRIEAFARHEERLQTLKLKPSEYVIRQIRVTPYPTESTGWIIEQSHPDICMFSSDYPHLEGGRNPYGRFTRALEKLTLLPKIASSNTILKI